jgi:capsular exopolysaccharide synthesis family protein
MSRIGEALRRAASANQVAEGWSDSAQPTAGVQTTANLDVYAEEVPRTQKTPAPAPEPALLSVAKPSVPSEHPGSWQERLAVAHEMPPIAIEQYRRLAGTLHELQAQRGIKTLMVSSSLPREGKTLTITNLALTLSHSYRRKVLLIDADLRHPSIHEVFGLRNTAGLADVVRTAGRQVPIIELSEHLSVLTAGHPDMNPLANLTSRHVADLLQRASREFDWVLMDTPPIGLISDAHLVSRMCEAALFVVGAGSTPYDLVQRGLAELGDDRIIGVVLNRMKAPDLPHGEDYGHYYNLDHRVGR